MALSKVVIIHGKGVLSRDGDIDQEKLLRMYSRGIQIMLDQPRLEEALHILFQGNDRVGVKINAIGGKMISTRPEVSLSFAQILEAAGVQDRNIIIWDRTNRELREAGYRLNFNRNSFKILGTDTRDVGYESRLVSHFNIGSLFSKIQSRQANDSVSLAILKDHGMAGVTAGMKNYFGAIHNPNKYHDTNCNPFVAELFDTDYIKGKHKLSVLDALVVQYHRGPAYHARWAKKYEALIFSLDPVAADFIGWQVIEKLRAEKGLPTLKEENRNPVYLSTAQNMGLGKANSDDVKVIEEEL